MTLTTVQTEREIINGTTFEATRFTLGHYEVEREVVLKDNVKVSEIISVRADYDYQHENYIPGIYANKRFGAKKYTFEIQTTSYGSLGTDDIQKVIAGYQEAVEAVKILEKNFG